MHKVPPSIQWFRLSRNTAQFAQLDLRSNRGSVQGSYSSNIEHVGLTRALLSPLCLSLVMVSGCEIVFCTDHSILLSILRYTEKKEDRIEGATSGQPQVKGPQVFTRWEKE
jgi:hypothetical protein